MVGASWVVGSKSMFPETVIVGYFFATLHAIGSPYICLFDFSVLEPEDSAKLFVEDLGITSGL